MAEELYGIQETVDYFDLGIAFKESVELAKADDGKVDVLGRDYIHFLKPITMLPKAITGTSSVPKELGDLSDTEIAQLEEKFGEIIHDERYQRLFRGLAIMGSALEDIITDGKDTAEV